MSSVAMYCPLPSMDVTAISHILVHSLMVTLPTPLSEYLWNCDIPVTIKFNPIWLSNLCQHVYIHVNHKGTTTTNTTTSPLTNYITTLIVTLSNPLHKCLLYSYTVTLSWMQWCLTVYVDHHRDNSTQLCIESVAHRGSPVDQSDLTILSKLTSNGGLYSIRNIGIHESVLE